MRRLCHTLTIQISLTIVRILLNVGQRFLEYTLMREGRVTDFSVLPTVFPKMEEQFHFDAAHLTKTHSKLAVKN